MSSKKKTAATKKEARPALVPILRFPEFQNTTGWASRTLGKFLIERNEYPQEPVPLFSLTIEDGVTPKTERYERAFLVKDANNAYKLMLPEDFAFNPMNLRFGAIGRHSGSEAVAVSKYYNIFSCDLTADAKFCEFYFRSDPMIAFYDNMAIGSLIEKRRVHFSDFLKFDIPFPSIPEQQKIAECLSSVNELMFAQTRKVDALKTHKKGLMQQLFPREGETQPRLRFPEFRNAGEWKNKSLGEIVVVASGQVDPTKPPYCDLPQIGSENIESNTGKLVNVKSAGDKGVKSGNYSFDESDVLYSKIRPALNKAAAPDFKGICSADIYPIRPANGGLLRSYLLYLLLSQKFLEYAIRISERGKIPKINRDGLLTYKVLIPSPNEQQCIASCLSGLDALITAETQKLEALKIHKKGLMQQLFPSPEEVEA